MKNFIIAFHVQIIIYMNLILKIIQIVMINVNIISIIIISQINIIVQKKKNVQINIIN